LNNFLPKDSLVVLLLLAFFVTSSSNHFLGIHGHPSSMTQLNVPKAFIVASGVFNNASAFSSSFFSCVSYHVPVLVDCSISSLGEPLFF